MRGGCCDEGGGESCPDFGLEGCDGGDGGMFRLDGGVVVVGGFGGLVARGGEEWGVGTRLHLSLAFEVSGWAHLWVVMIVL
jgi:hypothetical protein